MDGSKLSPEQIETIRAWIDAGAPGPAAGEPAPEANRDHSSENRTESPVKPQIFDLAYSPDGKLLALAGYQEVRLVDPATKQELAQAHRPRRHGPRHRLLARWQTPGRSRWTSRRAPAKS